MQTKEKQPKVKLKLEVEAAGRAREELKGHKGVFAWRKINQ